MGQACPLHGNLVCTTRKMMMDHQRRSDRRKKSTVNSSFDNVAEQSSNMVASKQYRVILVSDLDHTMVDHTDKTHASLLRFNELWQSQFASDSLLVFSTGRSRHLYEQLRTEAPLLTPDVLICSVGTEIFWESAHEEDKQWSSVLSEGWDIDQVRSIAAGVPELKLQQESEQRPFKASYHLQLDGGRQAEHVLQQLKEQLQAAGLKFKVVYSGGVDVDVLPAGASKGDALKFLLSEVPAPSAGVQVNGDSGNDIELLAVPGVCGCMVSNALPELREWVAAHKTSHNLFEASERCAGGIIEGLQYFKLLPCANA